MDINVNVLNVNIYPASGGTVISGTIPTSNQSGLLCGVAPTAYPLMSGASDGIGPLSPTASSRVTSGMGHLGYAFCNRCRQHVYDNEHKVAVTGPSGFIATYCWNCAGYDYAAHSFHSAEELMKRIRKHIPLSGDLNIIVANAVESHYRSMINPY